MLYILEGCDGSGKSTVAAKLKEVLDAEVIHCSQMTPNNFAFFNQIIEASAEKNIIADRFCYGQFVYQEEHDRPLREKGIQGEVPALEVLHHLEADMLKTGVKVIHVTAPADVIKERLALRKENLINGLTVEEVLIRYEAIKKMSMLPWVVWNTGGEE